MAETLHTLADEALMLRYAQGQAPAFDVLYSRHKGWLYRTLTHQLGNATLAADVFQETWMALVKSAPNYQASAKFTTWLYLLARQRLIDATRKQKSSKTLFTEQKPENEDDAFNQDLPDIPDEALAPHVLAQRAQLGQALIQSLEQLPPEQREVFVLAYEGLTVEEIAQATGQPHEATKSRLRYARNKLKTTLLERFGPTLAQDLKTAVSSQPTANTAEHTGTHG